MSNRIEKDGFIISARPHSYQGQTTKAKGFMNGIWYGYIDGVGVTAPCRNAERAINDAAQYLEKPCIECLKEWVEVAKRSADPEGLIPLHEKLIEKLRQYGVLF